MKRNQILTGAKALLVFCCVILFSFIPNRGGDSFEVHVNGKKILQEYVYASKAVQTVQLNPNSPNDKIEVYYSHCGKVGKSRYITIKDENERPLKVWKFADASADNAAMTFKLKDLLGLKKNKTSRLKLFYSSYELPKGRILATIATDEDAVANK